MNAQTEVGETQALRSQDANDIAEFLAWLSSKGRSKKTHRTYTQSCESLSTFLASRGMPLLEEATREHIESWLKWLHDKGNKPATVRNRFSGVQQLYNWMLHADIRRDHPMERIATPRVPEQVQPDYSPEQVSQLLNAIPTRTAVDLRDRALVAMLYDTGIRCEELCNICVGDVSRDTRRLIIRSGKGGRGRIVAYSYETATMLNRYLRKRGGWDAPAAAPLFLAKDGARLTTNAVRMLMLRRFSDAGLEFHGTHGFRRAWAQEYLNAGGDGMDLKQLGGWNSLTMVLRYTKRSAQERALRTVDAYSPMARLGTL